MHKKWRIDGNEIYMDGAKDTKCHFGQSSYITKIFRLKRICGICIPIVDLNWI